MGIGNLHFFHVYNIYIYIYICATHWKLHVKNVLRINESESAESVMGVFMCTYKCVCIYIYIMMYIYNDIIYIYIYIMIYI